MAAFCNPRAEFDWLGTFRRESTKCHALALSTGVLSQGRLSGWNKWCVGGGGRGQRKVSFSALPQPPTYHDDRNLGSIQTFFPPGWFSLRHLLHYSQQQQFWLRWISSVDCLWRRRVILRHTRHVLSCPCAIWGSISLLLGTVAGDRRRPFRRAYPLSGFLSFHMAKGMYTHVYTSIHMHACIHICAHVCSGLNKLSWVCPFSDIIYFLNFFFF